MEIKLDLDVERIINEKYSIDASVLREFEERNQIAIQAKASFNSQYADAPTRPQEPLDTDSTIQNIEQNLKYEIELKTKELNSTLDLLAQSDLKIDKIDLEIQKIEGESLKLVDEINAEINKIKAAYEFRVTAGCVSDLIWSEIGGPIIYYNDSGNPVSLKNYRVIKNPSQKSEINYYGIKYYQRPLNRDYGFNVEFDFNGTIGVGQSTLAVLTPNIIQNIKVGDQVSDNVDTPESFGLGAFPSIVGIGTTQLLGITTSKYASISIGSSILAITGIGSTQNILINDYVTNQTIFDADTKVVGFGTTVATISYTSSSSGFISTDVVVPSVLLNKNAIGVATDVLIGFGTYSNYPSLTLSSNSLYNLNNVNFSLIRSIEDINTNFNYTKSPIDPVKIAISNTTQLGLGHSSILINNGSSSIPVNWREVLEDSEPEVGNEKAIYYVGISSWPHNPNIGYAEEGKIYNFTNDITASYTSTSPVFGVDPQNNSNCISYASSITTAQNNFEAVKQRNLSRIQQLIAAANSLRKVRNKREMSAWAYLQSSSHLRKEIDELKQQYDTIISVDYESL